MEPLIINFKDLDSVYWDSVVNLEQKICLFAGNDYSSNPWNVSNFKSVLPGKGDLSFFIVNSIGVIGFSICYKVFRGWAHISRFGIEPDCWGSGLGKTLLQYQLNNIINYSVSLVTVETGFENIKAINLYKRCNFTELERNTLEEYVCQRNRNGSDYIGPNRKQLVLINYLSNSTDFTENLSIK